MMTWRALFYYQVGGHMVWIREEAGDPGRVELMFDEEIVGSYHSVAAAAIDAGGGHTGHPQIDRARIPHDVGDWDSGGGD